MVCQTCGTDYGAQTLRAEPWTVVDDIWSRVDAGDPEGAQRVLSEYMAAQEAPATPAAGPGTSGVATGAPAGAGEVGLGDALRAYDPNWRIHPQIRDIADRADGLQRTVDSLTDEATRQSETIERVRNLVLADWESIEYDRDALIDELRAALRTFLGDGEHVQGVSGPGVLDRVTDLFEKWAAEENEHTVAGEYGLAEGLRVAIDDLRTAVHGCDHASESGDEGPIADLGRMPTRWRCDSCGRVREDTQ
jgi:hypothetical protein